MEYCKLSNGMKLPKMVLGSFNISSQDALLEMVKTALAQGVNAFDTAPSYGSEEILGNALKYLGIARNEVFISNKVDGWQMYENLGEIEMYLDISLRKLKTDFVDLLLVHWPFPKYLLSTWNCMEKLYKKGKVRAIGLCNIDVRTYRKFIAEGIEIKPHIIQNEISPFNADIASTQLFFNEGIVVEAYSPLCRMIQDIRSNEILNELAKKYNKSIAQIILRWHIERGIVPVFTSSKAQRIVENTTIWDFSIDNNDVEQITSLDRHYKIFPESFGCPGY